MPEGPQVARHARMQGERLIGRRLRADSPNGRSDDVAVLVDGLELVGIEAVGKHLLYDFGDERWLHVHLGRFGKFVAGDMPLREPQGVLRFRLFTDEVWYELRGAIAVEMYDAEARERLMGRIGPNPLDRDADPLAAYAKLAASRAPIGTLMMDQSVVGGIGNIYRSEVLFLNRVHPRTPSHLVPKKTWLAMWRDLERVMADGAKIGKIVTTWPKDREHPKGAIRAGERFYVYHRTGLPCRHCGTLIVTATLANRSMFWCPDDQIEIRADEPDVTKRLGAKKKPSVAKAPATGRVTAPKAPAKLPAKKLAARASAASKISKRAPLGG